MLTIASMETAYFIRSKLARGVALKADLIRLNYEHLSPFAHPFMLHYRAEETLYLWFLRDKPATRFAIPEAYLLFKNFDPAENTVALFDTAPRRVIVAKGGILEAAFTLPDGSAGPEAALAGEYPDCRLKHFSADQHAAALHASLRQLTIRELAAFATFHTDAKTVARTWFDRLAYPAAGLLLIYMAADYAGGYRLRQEKARLVAEYRQLKTHNLPLKKALRRYRREIRFFDELRREVYGSPDPVAALYALYDIIHPEDHVTLTAFRMHGDRLRIQMATRDDALKYLKRFNADPRFEEVLLANTHKRRDGTRIYGLRMRVVEEAR